jgi:hypothetical protein
MKTVSSEDVKVVMFCWFTSEIFGADALLMKGMILHPIRCVLRCSWNG